MALLTQQIDPGEAGLDVKALDRLDQHFAHRVDEGRLPGFLVSVARGGRVAPLTAYGLRDVAAGLPVVASTNSGGPDVIVDGETGVLVPPRSVDALAAALDTLAGDRERCRAMGDAAAAAMQRARSWSHFVDDMLSQYGGVRARQLEGLSCAS